MKAIVVLGLVLIGSISYANSKLSDPFSVGIVGRVCIKDKCQNYSQVSNAQAELNEEQNKLGSYTGEIKFTYEIEGVKLVSSISVSEFEFNGNKQINLFMKTSEENSATDLGSSEIIVTKMSELNSVAQYSVPIVRDGLRIEPGIIVGPTMFAVRLKMKLLFR
jgi:hypothetical protein